MPKFTKMGHKTCCLQEQQIVHTLKPNLMIFSCFDRNKVIAALNKTRFGIKETVIAVNKLVWQSV